MKIVFTRPAQAGLREIAQYIARDNRRRATSFIADLRAKALDIANMPLGFPLVARYERQGVRRRVFGNYEILYRIDQDKILILRILHSARDTQTLLTPDD